jgi:hypothetical protein
VERLSAATNGPAAAAGPATRSSNSSTPRALPFTPLADALGFVPLPAKYFVFLGSVTFAYLGLVQRVKRRPMGTDPAARRTALVASSVPSI